MVTGPSLPSNIMANDDPVEAEPVEAEPLPYGPPRRPWWRRPRWHLALGLASLAFGYGITLSYWPGPSIFMGFGAFLVGLSVPLPGDGE